MKKRVRFWIDYESGEDSDGVCRGDTVHEPEDGREPRWTGLFDAKGEPIMRDPYPFGFRRRM